METDEESDEWPPKTIDGVIDAFFMCAEKEDMDLVDELTKDRISWLARNLDPLLLKIADFGSPELLDELGDKAMNIEQAKVKTTEIIWEYWHDKL